VDAPRCVFCDARTSAYKKVILSPQQAVKAHKAMRYPGSSFFYILDVEVPTVSRRSASYVAVDTQRSSGHKEPWTFVFKYSLQLMQNFVLPNNAALGTFLTSQRASVASYC
jgi:hypothetical protein